MYRSAADGRLVRLNMAVAATAAMLLVAVGCAGQAPSAPVASSFQVSISTAPPLTSDEIQRLQGVLGDPSGSPPAQQLSAAAFDDYSSMPIAENGEWRHFVEVYTGVKDAAMANGWDVLVEGYVQSAAPVNTPEPLSQRRADTTRDALIGVGYPPTRVQAVGRGVGGPNPDDRRVVVSFVRHTR